MAERQIDIEAKLLALLELSKSVAEGTEHEAKLALETAIRLAAKHGISISSLADKRKGYSGGDWFQSVKVDDVEYTTERYTEMQLQSWGQLAERFGWQRHRRTSYEREGLILMYRMKDRFPKVELRLFERPWGDVEFEVVRNPDPIIGQLNDRMKMGFDCIDLGTNYQDFRDWLESDKIRPVK